MTCSKIFSGYLPELTNEIIENFRYDYKTLHSCILVNRLWCCLAIPLLWEDPFSIPTESYNFIEIYLRNLSEDDKMKLNKYGNNNLIPSNTLFNYPSFIKCLNTWKLSYSTDKWISAVRPLTVEQPAKFSTQNINLSSSHPNLDSLKFIFWLLFKVFINNGVNLRTFEIEITETLDATDHEYFNSVFDLILKNPNFIRNIKNLKLRFSETITNITPFLKFLYSNCKSITSLYFRFPRNNNDNDNLLIEKYLSRIINSQQNLKKIVFKRNNLFKGLSLLSFKSSNFSNTLKTIVFNKIDFKNLIILREVFDHLNILESIHIFYCRSLNIDFVQQIINITKPFKLRSLLMDEILQIEPLQLLLQKSGDYLENVGFEPSLNNDLKQQLFEIIKNYCTKIKFFDLRGFNNQNIYTVLDSIKNIAQNLNYLSIEVLSYHYQQSNSIIELSSIILVNLGQILPFKLEYLNLALVVNLNDLEKFLKNSQNTFIKKLLIRNDVIVENVNILPFIKEYIMKKKKVKYLAIIETFFLGKIEDLSSCKDVVKEFELHGIKIKNYNELNTDCHNFIKELEWR
ncbi:hypothetical protein RclHR1_14130006 [Rhizophagus clarus]|uniref:F-box domain-containing protein n=1 Tax=Rhizophagus clarus TaxID=94130 RepID=A0A2Z6QDM6_9GLOM|nr:hypothetical protein RclHR1_14130006 [Rhizophagus clarus]GES79283.1 hypothetical protein GLOIN_2v1867510 [Rhizophagus clarus]